MLNLTLWEMFKARAETPTQKIERLIINHLEEKSIFKGQYA